MKKYFDGLAILVSTAWVGGICVVGYLVTPVLVPAGGAPEVAYSQLGAALSQLLQVIDSREDAGVSSSWRSGVSGDNGDRDG